MKITAIKKMYLQMHWLW